MARRQCDDCKANMGAYEPRTRVGDQMLCDACKDSPRGGLVSATPKTSMRFEAHDSGDGMTVFHCPFCGSGQVLARSDRTIECQFCHTAFTVQVQPVYPNFPQTVDGQPMQVPGMPGQAGPPPGGPPPGSPMGGMDTDPSEPGAPMDPAALGADGQVPPTGEDDEEADDESGSGDSSGHEKSKGNPFAKKTFKTHTGALLTGEEYANYLAIRTSNNPARTAALVKAARGR